MATKRIEILNRYTNTCQWAGDIEDTGSHRRNLGAAIKAALLTDANLRGANLRGANLMDADLTGAVLMDANLMGANLMGANLRGANLMDANLMGANLMGANIRGANIRGANLMGEKIASLRVLAGLYQYQCMAFVTVPGAPWVRMGCLWKSVEEWDRIGIRGSNPNEFQDDGSAKCEERVRAFEFARDMALRMAEEWKVENQKKEE